MADSKTHFYGGAAVVGAVDLVWQLERIRNSPNPPIGFWDTLNRINFLELLALAGLGGTVGLLADCAEPATSPNHRAFFHGLTFGGCVAYAAFGKHTKNLSDEDRLACAMTALAYLSHLALDATTPKGLPLLT